MRSIADCRPAFVASDYLEASAVHFRYSARADIDLEAAAPESRFGYLDVVPAAVVATTPEYHAIAVVASSVFVPTLSISRTPAPAHRLLETPTSQLSSPYTHNPTSGLGAAQH